MHFNFWSLNDPFAIAGEATTANSAIVASALQKLDQNGTYHVHAANDHNKNGNNWQNRAEKLYTEIVLPTILSTFLSVYTVKLQPV
jgi:hypothetical protein